MRDDRKYFSIVFFILFLVLLSGFITPYLIENQKENWDKELSDRIAEIESSVTSIYKEKENSLLNASHKIKRKLFETLKPGNASYRALLRGVNDQEFKNYILEVFAPNGRLIAWNEDIAIPQEDIFPLTFTVGETYFYNSDLIIYLSIIDTLHIETDLFYYSVSLPIEKNYSLQNPYFQDINFTKEISNKFLTQFEIAFNSFSQRTKDGRKYSFDLLNNKKNKIGTVTFVKPALDASINSIYEKSSIVQSLLIILGIFFLGLGFKNDFKEISSRILRLFLFILYCAAFRALIYFVGFPSNLLEGPLVDPSYFSSAFGGGIVKSPIEFFITNLFFILISVTAFRYLINYIQTSSAQKRKPIFLIIISIIPLILFFLIMLRGLTASIRSVIFDSTLRYFKEPELIPNLPSLVMNLNILITGLGAILFLTGTIILITSFITAFHQKKLKLNFIYLFLITQLLGFIFIFIQKEPLITPFASFIFITLIFLLAYQILYVRLNSIFNYIYAAFTASVITISLLNYFQQQLEKESLKTAAIEINRPNDNLLRFMITETLQNAVKDGEVLNAFYRRDTNYEAAAFMIWSESPFQRESINSSVTIYDRNRNILGEFSIGVPEEIKYPPQLLDYNGSGPEIIEVNRKEGNGSKNFSGIIPVNLKGVVLGFISASVSFDLQNLGTGSIPEFLVSKKNIINSVIDINELKIFEFTNLKLTQVYGDIYPSRDQTNPIINAEYSDDNETWLKLSLNEESYLTYALKTETDEGNTKITSVSLIEKHITWNLFNFFKIFIIHSIFIFLLFLTFFLLRLSSFKYSFRTQLLIAFLLISILPVGFLAVYNRQIIKERSESAIFNELNERSQYLINHISSQLKKHADRDIINAFKNAAAELGISFGVYETTEQIYNSKSQYYQAGLFTSKLNPKAHFYLNYLSYREFLAEEEIEDFKYDSFYKKISIDGRDLIIGVNDAFNKIKLPYTTIDVDVFLFGVYAFAVIIIIIISTILANKISSPIRRLTKATESVAHGDLNVELENKEKGELRDLFEGFNLMTKELQRNQAELAEMEREIAWKEMAKQVAHEIKNPLTPMKLAVQQLKISYKDKNKNFDSIFEKVSSTILSQIENLSLIASEFSRFARMPNFKLEEVDLINVLNDTIPLFVDENIKIENDAKFSSALIEADKNQIRRLLINLIRNSIQAEATVINFNIYSENNHFSFIIKDNGKGIPIEARDKIFDSNFTTKKKGMGLGLKLAKRFIEGINGSIILLKNSEPGAAFKIVIPKFHKE